MTAIKTPAQHPMTPHVGDRITFYVRHHNRIETRSGVILQLHPDGTADLEIDVTELDIVSGCPASLQTHAARCKASPKSGEWKWSSHQAKRRTPQFDVSDQPEKE